MRVQRTPLITACIYILVRVCMIVYTSASSRARVMVTVETTSRGVVPTTIASATLTCGSVGSMVLSVRLLQTVLHRT